METYKEKRRALSEAFKRKVVKLIASGKSQAEVGRMLGISQQRVFQIIKEMKV